MTGRRMPPILYFVVLFLAAMVSYWSMEGKTIIRSGQGYTGAVLVILGILIILWAQYLFKKTGTSSRPDRKPKEFIISGPFRLSRNPMYLGLTLILAGEALWLGQIYLMLSSVLFLGICQTLYIPEEERTLAEVFGPEYIEYKKRVRRWL